MESPIDPDARYNDSELARLLGISLDGLRARRAKGAKTPLTRKTGQINRTFGHAILKYFDECSTVGG